MGTFLKQEPIPKFARDFLSDISDRWRTLKAIAACLKEEGLDAIAKDMSPLWTASPRSGTLPPEIVIFNGGEDYTLYHDNGNLILWERGLRHIKDTDGKEQSAPARPTPILTVILEDPECFKKIAEKIK